MRLDESVWLRWGEGETSHLATRWVSFTAAVFICFWSDSQLALTGECLGFLSVGINRDFFPGEDWPAGTWKSSVAPVLPIPSWIHTSPPETRFQVRMSGKASQHHSWQLKPGQATASQKGGENAPNSKGKVLQHAGILGNLLGANVSNPYPFDF